MVGDEEKVNNRWLKHVASIRSGRRRASPPPASWEVTTQRRPWRHRVRDQVSPWWQPIIPDCDPHAVPDRASLDPHPHTESSNSVKQCCIRLKFGSDDSAVFHAVSSLNPPASRDDTHSGSCLWARVCVCVRALNPPMLRSELCGGKHWLPAAMTSFTARETDRVRTCKWPKWENETVVCVCVYVCVCVCFTRNKPWLHSVVWLLTGL